MRISLVLTCSGLTCSLSACARNTLETSVFLYSPLERSCMGALLDEVSREECYSSGIPLGCFRLGAKCYWLFFEKMSRLSRMSRLVTGRRGHPGGLTGVADLFCALLCLCPRSSLSRRASFPRHMNFPAWELSFLGYRGDETTHFSLCWVASRWVEAATG